jgi:lipopolysaccharide heptosyltransferase II
MRILVLRLTALGDVLLCTPVLGALRRLFPEAELDLCTDARYAALFEEHPDLTRVVPYEHGGAGWWALGQRLRKRRYDVVVDLQHKVRTGILARLARPRRRLTLVKRRMCDWVPSLWGRPLRLTAHTADLYVQAVAPLGVPPLGADERRLRIALSPEARERAQKVLCGLGIAAPFLALAPGAGHATKRWGAARFAALAELLQARGLGEPLAVGGPADRAEIEQSGLRSTPLDLDLPVLAAVLARARALVCGDSGPLHLAAAVGTPVVGIYGPTDPRRWGPVGVPHRVVRLPLACAPCRDHGGPRCPLGTHACMRDLDPARVADALAELFSP